VRKYQVWSLSVDEKQICRAVRELANRHPPRSANLPIDIESHVSAF